MAEKEYIISSDCTSDMMGDYYTENNVTAFGMSYELDGKEVDFDPYAVWDSEEFYSLLRSGAVIKTSQVQLDAYISKFEELAKKNLDIIHLSFSSALSGTYQSACIAADDVRERYPNAKIYIVDSKSASLGQGLLLDYMVRLKKEGKTIDELRDIIEKDKLTAIHYFTVDDLTCLRRGGRISMVKAILCTTLGIKPFLHVDDMGRLIYLTKARSRKQSMQMLVTKLAENHNPEKNKTIFINYGGCLDDAKQVAAMIEEQVGYKDFYIAPCGALIGAHSGPGTLSVFFFGNSRNEEPTA